MIVFREMRNWGFILAGVALAWYGIFRGAKGLEIKLKSYRFNSVNLSDYTMQLVLNLSIKNPLLVGVKIKGVVGDVYAQGVKIGTVNSNLLNNINILASTIITFSWITLSIFIC